VSGENAATLDGVPVLVPLERVDNIFSGRAAIVYKPIENVSMYASFGTSANPSLEGLLYSPADARTDPEKTRTYELGTKWDFFHSRLLMTGAFFVVNKTDARTPGVLPGEPFTLDGDQRVQGLEFSATGSVTRNWQIYTGYTYLDSEIEHSATAAEIGKSLINTPENSFNIWSTYRLNRLIFGGGARYIGERFGNNINTRLVDSYWVADAMASFRVSRNLDLRLNMNNLGDKYFIDRIGGGHIIPGAGRLITLSSAFNF
jgi:catecholate siderophore receptor